MEYKTANRFKKDLNNTTSNIFLNIDKSIQTEFNTSLSKISSKYTKEKFLDIVDDKYLIKDNRVKFEEYKNTSNKIMRDYHYNSKYDVIPAETLMNTKLFADYESKILKERNNTLRSSTEGNNFKILINNEEYKNPIYSLVTLKKNQMIYKCMSFNQKNREIDKLKEAINQIDSNNQKFSDHKIKITNTAPKYLEGHGNNKHKNIPMNEMNTGANHLSKKHSNDLKINTGNKPLHLYGVINYDKETNSTNMFGYYVYSRKNFPEGREQFSWCIDGNELALYGGLTTCQSNYVWIFDLVNLEWRKIESKNTPGILRYGHSIAFYQKKIYIFGGRTRYQNIFHYPEIEIFDIEEKMWISPILYTFSTLKPRRNHASRVIGQHMLIHGGISEDEEYLSDTHLLSFHPLKWVKVTLESYDQPPTLSWHACCLVLPNDQLHNPKLSVFKLPDQNISRKIGCKIKERGVYFFGGRYNSEGDLTNGLWVLRIGKPTFQWIKLLTLGEPPCPRYAHSMGFYEEGNYLIIHGGRNDSSNDGYALNDTYLLDLWTFNWIKVMIYFDSPTTSIYKRCSHSCMVYSNKYSLI